MKEILETNNSKKFKCEFCDRSFVREKTWFSHICEYKHRWQQRDERANQIGFQSFVDFYKKNTSSVKNKTYIEFIKSSYYIAFTKFGNYCVDVKCVNVARYIDWLTKNKIKIDQWCQDSIYDRFVCEYLRTEDVFDAINRSVKTTIELSEQDNLQVKDYLRYGNANKICQAIIKGKISPWMLYQCESGVNFLGSLRQDQEKIIIDYINPELWALKFKKNNEDVKQIKNLLKQAGY